MKIILHRNFERQYKKLRPNEKLRFKKQRDIFLQNPFHPILNNHPLHGTYRECRSINVGGDLRVVYEMAQKDVAHFLTIDTHDKLYR